MSEMLPGLAVDADDVVREARVTFRPARTFCLFSGGHDSTVLAHRMREHYDELAFIDTGTALPGVREFVDDFAARLYKPLRVLEAGDAFREMVLGSDEWWENFGDEYRTWRDRYPLSPMSEFNGLVRIRYGRAHGDSLGNAPHGFPGPAAHNVAYTRLKERQVEQLIREAKAEFAAGNRLATIMLLTGTRRGESARRARTQKAAFRKVKSQVWVNPLIDWSNGDVRAYRGIHKLPESDVSAFMHRSGECNCGAFAAPGERAMLISSYPEWWRENIEPLEQRARELGLPGCVWGERPHESPAPTGEMCSDCQLRLAA